MRNINTEEYWNERFASESWKKSKGEEQTIMHAQNLLSHMNIDSEFDGTLLDFGCALGNALPLYRERYPKARLLGMDISQTSIKYCREKYGNIAEFIVGDSTAVPTVDIIVSTHTFEHIPEDKKVVKALLKKCREMFIVVPFKEYPIFREHLRSYDVNYYKEAGKYEWKIVSPQHGIPSKVVVTARNLLRLIRGERAYKKGYEIIYHFSYTNNKMNKE